MANKPRNYQKLNISLHNKVIEAMDKDRHKDIHKITRSQYVNDILWFALCAPEIVEVEQE